MRKRIVASICAAALLVAAIPVAALAEGALWAQMRGGGAAQPPAPQASTYEGFVPAGPPEAAAAEGPAEAAPGHGAPATHDDDFLNGLPTADEMEAIRAEHGGSSAYAESVGSDGEFRDSDTRAVAVPEHNPLDLNRDPAEPFDPSVYYARSFLGPEGQKAWDLSLKTLLSYDNSDNSHKLNVNGNTPITVDYEAAGIYPTEAECTRMQKSFTGRAGCDMPDVRLFHLVENKPVFLKTENGIVCQQQFMVGKGSGEGNRYQTELRKMADAVNGFISSTCTDDMTIYQQTRRLLDVYTASIKYDNSNPRANDPRGALIDKRAICGGYSQGWMYILQQLGIPAFYIEGWAGGFHAWNYVQAGGKWYVADTTWGGDNWWFAGAAFANQTHEPYSDTKNFPLPELARDSAPIGYSKYPSLTLDVASTMVTSTGDPFELSSVVKGWTSIYNENLADRIEYSVVRIGPAAPADGEEVYRGSGREAAFDPGEAGIYRVTVSLSDDHGNKASKTVQLTVTSKETVGFAPNVAGFSLLQAGKEVWYSKGYRFNDHQNPNGVILELPQRNGGHINFEALVGIRGTVRQNTEWGHNAKVAFRVEYLQENTTVNGEGPEPSAPTYTKLGQYQTKVHGWKTGAETISVEVPQEATHVRILSVASGSGNNHSGWVNVAAARYDAPVASTVAITGDMEGLIYTGSPVAAPQAAATGSTGAITYIWERAQNTSWEALAGPPAAAGAYRVTAQVASEGRYTSALSVPVPFSIAPKNGGLLTVPDLNSGADVDNLVITDGAAVLQKGTDYEVSEKAENGTVVVTITFKGNYSGTVTKSYAPDPGEEEADHEVNGTSPHKEDIPLIGTVKAPPSVISVSMPVSITWSFALEQGGSSGTMQVPENQKITNLDQYGGLNAKVTKVTDAGGLLQKMRITLNAKQLSVGTSLNLELGTATESGGSSPEIPLTLDASVTNGPVAAGEYTVVPTITLTRTPVS